MFVIILHYKKSLEAVERYLAAHSEYLDGLYREKKIIFSGPRVPRTGGVILAHHLTREEAEDQILKDPFYVHGVADYELLECKATKFDTSFKVFLDS